MTNEDIKAMSKEEVRELARTLTSRFPKAEDEKIVVVGWKHPDFGNQLYGIYRDKQGDLYKKSLPPF